MTPSRAKVDLNRRMPRLCPMEPPPTQTSTDIRHIPILNLSSHPSLYDSTRRGEPEIMPHTETMRT